MIDMGGLSYRTGLLPRCVLAAVWTAAALAKLFYSSEPSAAFTLLRNINGGVPVRALNLIVVSIELIIAAGLLLRSWRISAWASFAVSCAFLAYILVLTWTGGNVAECNCVGTIKLGLVPHGALLLSMMIMSLAIVARGIEQSRSHADAP